jgi:hypothetical protein
MQAKMNASRQLRSFGLIVGGGFAIIAFWPSIFRGESPRTWALAVAVPLIALALIYPRALGPLNRVWMVIGEALGWINSRVILTILYCGLIIPIGFVRRMMGNDPMRRKLEKNADTYKIPRVRRPASHMERQY